MPLQPYLPEISIAWRWFANFAAVVLITAIMSAIYIFSLSGYMPVDIWKTRGFTLITPTLQENGQLIYILNAEPEKSCPGYVQHTFLGNGGKSSNSPVVNIQRPLVRPGVPVNAKFSIQLPPTVTAGDWRVILSIVSQCPTHTDSDTMAEFFIKVEPM